MRLMERYIGRTLVSHVAVVLLVLLSLFFFSNLTTEMNKVGQGSYTTADAVLYCLMLLPRQAYELFPLVVLVGTILGIGAMASNNELTVLRAAGVSIGRISLAVMKSGFLLILLVVMMGETVAPQLEKQAHAQRLAALSRSVTLSMTNGFWARDGDDFINIFQLLPGGEATRLTRYRFNGRELIEISYAQKGRYSENSWLVGPVVTTRFLPDGVEKLRSKEERWASSITPEIVHVASISPERLALWELYDYIAYLHENALASQSYETAMWVRLFMPLATAGMILLALPFVFGSLRSVTIGQRVMIGSLLGIVFYLLNGMVSRLGLLYDITPVISAGAPTLLVYVAWFFLMRRVH